MTVKAAIVNGEGGRQYSAIVSEHYALRTESSVPAILPQGTRNRVRYYNEYAMNGGASNMAVNGSVTPAEFSIESSEEYDLYITDVQILIASNSIANNKFADLPALTAGWSLFVTEQGRTTFLLDSVTTTGELSIQAGGGFTDLANWNAANDNARVIQINIARAFPFDTLKGLRIGRGSKDRLVGYVQDDLSGLSEFTVRVIGARHYA